LNIQVYLPAPGLREYVQSIMVFSLTSDSGCAMPLNPFPPTPQHSLFFYIKNPVQTQVFGSETLVTSPACLLVGPQLTRVNIKMGHDHLMVHVGFKTGGLHKLTGVPMHLLLDQGYDASDVLGPDVPHLLEQLRNTPNQDQMVKQVEAFLWKKLKASSSPLPFDKALAQLVGATGNMPIEQVADLGCLSLKQFERKCRERIGLPPKVFARLIRFSNAYRLRETRPDLSWTQISYASGYFDQMHLIRDFKEFAGVTPGIITKDLGHTPYRLQSNILV
jgi:AraC-like DNA-binding protein